MSTSLSFNKGLSGEPLLFGIRPIYKKFVQMFLRADITSLIIER